MEWWLLLGLTLVALAVGGFTRLRRPRHRKPQEQTRNIYPLW
jgi:hypothetical protein